MTQYDLRPEVVIKDFKASWEGYEGIVLKLKETIQEKKHSNFILSIESYPGVRNEEIVSEIIEKMKPQKIIFSDDIAFDSKTITKMIKRNLTDDRVFGLMAHHDLEEFFDEEKLKKVQQEIKNAEGLIVIYGTGSTVITPKPDLLIYADLARWEIQLRYRAGAPNWKADNEMDDALRKFKRGYFFEWRVADRQKKKVFAQIDFLLDTNLKNHPKMVAGEDFRHALKQVASQPFRLVPYFDESVWGGQWMKEHFNLDPSKINYGWAFDGVPEENSLLLRFGEVQIEVPSINLVHQFPNELLGPKVYARFGTEFPIRFDYLDTVGGGNLSLQVHPLVEYAQEKFGIPYTQNESYYILDAKEDSTIYLGVKDDTTKEDLFEDLRKAEKGNYRFPDEKHINVFPVKKHDHYSIPAGTVHCGGPNTVVLEISATPYIFTFKLWDWERIGLDGVPRPVHLNHGEANIRMDFNTAWVKNNLINPFETLKENEHEKVERTGLHELEFIETRRYWFKESVEIETFDSVNMLNLVEGEEAIVESIDESFAPFTVHYGETFIVPEKVKKYIIRNNKQSGKDVAVLQAFVKNL
ncbi:class I mannose-6-phosphate isomerase [Bacillus sp. AFS017336]|uniref:class I mannose-6-phosphate isomerase n=1 Tax=Bacillus sp. AFS017336 TaxID=2033489 RepID=UPI000BF1B667|nr:class I mannose-6-phosphate isomerase [Bacillus sp. AFS017336]PEL13666.1 mannose-6-phosphate isomerase [Bacillus sp. AFS017336]